MVNGEMSALTSSKKCDVAPDVVKRNFNYATARCKGIRQPTRGMMLRRDKVATGDVRLESNGGSSTSYVLRFRSDPSILRASTRGRSG